MQKLISSFSSCFSFRKLLMEKFVEARKNVINEHTITEHQNQIAINNCVDSVSYCDNSSIFKLLTYDVL